MTKKIRAIGAVVVVGIWLIIAGFAWFSADEVYSFTERSYLDQFPDLNWENILEKDDAKRGTQSFMTEFNAYTLDQFPMRDGFRQIKALFHLYALQQSNNNGKYIHDGYMAEMTPLDEEVFQKNLESLQRVYEKYLENAENCNVYMAVIPDKNYFLAEPSGHDVMSMDYDKFFAEVQANTSWANHIDLLDVLDISDYYRTDTHWRQENIVDVAQKLANAMGAEGPKAEDFTVQKLEETFYGVYYGQIAVPVAGEDLYLLRSEVLDNCLVSYDGTPAVKGVYDWERSKVELVENSNGKYTVYGDMYEVFLSKESGMIVMENPNATTDKELVVFRDSFGRSLIPLLVQDYAKITVIDTRWLTGGTHMLDRFVNFGNQDVLFLYSTTVLNSVELK